MPRPLHALLLLLRNSSERRHGPQQLRKCFLFLVLLLPLLLLLLLLLLLVGVGVGVDLLLLI